MQVHLIHFIGIFSFLSIQFADIYTYIQTFESVLSSMCIKSEVVFSLLSETSFYFGRLLNGVRHGVIYCRWN